MSKFNCPVVRVESVEDHPNAERLSLVRLQGLGYLCISGKLSDGSHRYVPGDFCVYIPSQSVLPEWLLKSMGFWNDEIGKGTLAGSQGNRVKPIRLRGIFSEGVLYPVGWDPELALEGGGSVVQAPSPDDPNMEEFFQVELGEDVSGFLGIIKYEPEIPAHMSGQVANVFGHTVKYDFERVESQPDLFDSQDQVNATEKLHGTMMQIRYVPNLNHPEMFGLMGDILVCSKNRAAEGLAFKNNEENNSTVYVQVLRKLLSNGFEEKIKSVVNNLCTKQMCMEITTPVPITIVGEVYGKGVQDLHYGTQSPQLSVFDIQVGEKWLPRALMEDFCAYLSLTPVPVLYEGPFNPALLTQVRDGVSTLGGGHVREGIVIRHVQEVMHPVLGRKIAKMISPDYLLRKSKDATEYT